MADSPVQTPTNVGYGTWGSDSNSASNPWNYAGGLPSDMFNSSEAVNADRRSYEMQLQSQQFNSAEAQKNRDWQERLSNSSIQRAAADYKAAGYSPLALLGGSGASTPSGSVAHSSAASGHASSASGNGVSLLKGVVSLIADVATQGMSSAAKAAAQGATSGLTAAFRPVTSSSKVRSSPVIRADSDGVISEKEFQDLMSQLSNKPR